MKNISIEQARKLAVSASFIHSDSEIINPQNWTLEIIRHLGYVQIDTLQAVQRAHHHVLWSRFPEYQPQYLDQLLKERKIFEYWTHALAFVPMDDYPLYRARMAACYDPHDKWEKDRLQKYGALMKPIKESLRKNGAMTPAEIGETLSGDISLAAIRSALNLLFFRGEVTISHREKFRKVYVLAETIFPAEESVTSLRERSRLYILKALRAMGIADRNDLRDYLGNIEKDGINDELKFLIREEKIESCGISGQQGVYYLMKNGILSVEQTEPVCQLLSPFDPLVINRRRLKKLFDFDYRLECYFPAEKRVYGYFVLPVLWNHRFVARVDVRVNRGKKILKMLSLTLEDNLKNESVFWREFANTLERFAVFNNCGKIQIDKIMPVAFRKIVKEQLTRISDKISVA